MKSEDLRKQLVDTILPFWLSHIDPKNGGFIEEVNYNLVDQPDKDKSSVMQSRFLWSFSASYTCLKQDSLLTTAHHGFNFIKEYLWDPVFGGMYWSVTSPGKPSNSIKHLYAQSFAIYGLSEYYKACKQDDVRELAIAIFQLIETHAFKKELAGYHEEFTQEWEPVTNNQITAKIETLYFTTNSHLHLLEAYTNLYMIWPNSFLKDKIFFLQSLFIEKIFHPDGYCQQYFDKTWQSLTPGLSFGHDIESAWLLDRSLEVVGMKNPILSNITKQIVEYQLIHGLNSELIMENETDFITIDRTKVWWVQAEAMIGFFNAFQKTNHQQYLSVVEATWAYIQCYFIDPRENSEWFAALENRRPIPMNLSDSWKGPYHTVRMYLELIKRMEDN